MRFIMITPVSVTYLKQEAKKLKKTHGLTMSKALDEVSRKLGFCNYRHYLNIYESNLEQLKSSKEVLLKKICLESDLVRKMELAVLFIQDFKIPFRDILDILNQFQNSEKAVQFICEKLNLVENEIRVFLLNDFLSEEGQDEINFRAPYFIAKKIFISHLDYEINGDTLNVDGQYVLQTEFELELDHNDPLSKDARFNDREFEGSFRVEINKDKTITLIHSSMSMDSRLEPIHGFTEEEVEDYYNRFPNERGLI
ncbi:hypothetical protein SC738_08990 [Legionella pneumophila serogroup 1]|nr:hypothetical protein [Legionella pneumophila subsp. fraseri]MDW9039267.1 hypothetical protein [Legionella pneumophila subsp. fraseri]MDW9042115.1 hypothetical protein [Legionella pneumophila subsp. fraseri]MDX1862878.1 hypothetical protein [Legionella pneumophila subsp. fraseri]